MLMTLWLLSGLGTFTMDTMYGKAKNRRHGLPRHCLNLLVCLLMGPLYAPLLGLGVALVVPVAFGWGVVKAMRTNKAEVRLERYCRRAA